jgi:hypothetical protein
MKKYAFLYLAIFSFCLVPYHVFAADFDGSTPLLCAVTDAMECNAGDGCQETTVEIMNIPQFVKVDFEQKKISAVRENDAKRFASIKNSERAEGKLIMQGTSENGRGWSVIISEETGKMSAAITDDQFGFVLFGACTRL